VVECLPRKCEALSSNSSTAKNKKKQKIKKTTKTNKQKVKRSRKGLGTWLKRAEHQDLPRCEALSSIWEWRGLQGNGEQRRGEVLLHLSLPLQSRNGQNVLTVMVEKIKPCTHCVRTIISFT
jgi:hypothetical protein